MITLVPFYYLSFYNHTKTRKICEFNILVNIQVLFGNHKIPRIEAASVRVTAPYEQANRQTPSRDSYSKAFAWRIFSVAMITSDRYFIVEKACTVLVQRH